MNVEFLRIGSVLIVFQLTWWLISSTGHAAAAASAAAKAKHEAESSGYAFELSHDDIVSKAKREGRLKVLSSLESDLKACGRGFQEKISFH